MKTFQSQIFLCKLNMQNSAYKKPVFWNFNATCLLFIFIEVHRNALEL